MRRLEIPAAARRAPAIRRGQLVSSRRVVGPVIAVLLAFYLIAAIANAQVVISAAATGDPTSNANERRPANTPPPARTNQAQPLSDPFVRWGALEIRPGASLDFAHASGLRAPNGAIVSTDIATYTADFVLKRANLWSTDYSVAWTGYSSAQFRDTVSHYFRADYRLTRSDWNLDAEQTYRRSDQTLLETARQTKQETVTTHGALTLRIGHALMFTASGGQQLTFTEALADIYEWSVQPMLNYAPSKDLSLGVGSSFGYVLVYHASDLVYAKPVGTVSWRVSKKTSVDSDFGFDEWKLIAGSKKTLGALHYRLRVRVEPTDSTTLSAAAERITMAAPFHDQVGESDRESLRLRQRLFKHFDLTFGPTIERVRYQRETGDTKVAREDHVRTFDATLMTTLRSRFRISLLCRFTKNQSDAAAMSFSSRQFGIQLALHY